MPRTATAQHPAAARTSQPTLAAAAMHWLASYALSN